MSTKILLKAAPKLMKLLFFFDPLVPCLIRAFLFLMLMRYKRQGMISEYNVRTSRLGKLSYEIGVHLVFKQKQVNTLVMEIVMSAIAGMG